MLKGLHEGVLSSVFGVLTVLGDIHREAENPAFVAVGKLIKGRQIAFFRGGYEGALVILHDGGGQRLGVGKIHGDSRRRGAAVEAAHFKQVSTICRATRHRRINP